MSIINFVKKIKITKNVEVANKLLQEDWWLLDVVQDDNSVIYHLGHIPQIDKKIALFENINYQ